MDRRVKGGGEKCFLPCFSVGQRQFDRLECDGEAKLERVLSKATDFARRFDQCTRHVIPKARD